jgi:MYXO-CTERM domain-containing protein
VTNKQRYSDVLSEVIVSWNQIEASWAAALVPDVIVDDMSPGFALAGSATPEGAGGWRGHFFHAPAADPSAPTITGTYTATLAAGTWTLLGFVPRSADATAQVTLTFTATDGPHAATLDQSQLGGRFYALGDYHFAGGPVVVKVTNGATSGEVAWDAIRFHALSLDAVPDGGPSDSDAGTGPDGGGGAGGEAGAVTGSTPSKKSGCSCGIAETPDAALGGAALVWLVALGRRARRARR